MFAPLGLQLDGVGKRFGNVIVLAGIDWTIAPAQCVGLVGSSGSGKTTLLRLLAGLESPDSGTVRYLPHGSGRKQTRARIGMVFQNLALWPHLTARQHVACVLNSAGSQEASTIESLLAEVRLPPEAWDRRPSQLSGGEGQRLALARALATGPQILLLDEPLTHLDAMLRADLLAQLAETIRRRGITVVYVTHAWNEAATLCQGIGVLDGGRLVQLGTPAELFWHPANANVARLTGPLVIVPKTWLSEQAISLDPLHTGWQGLPGASANEVWLRPHHVRITSSANTHAWQVAGCHPANAGWLLDLVDSQARRLTLPYRDPTAEGQSVGLQLVAFPQDSSSTPPRG